MNSHENYDLLKALKDAEKERRFLHTEVHGITYVFDPLYERTVGVYGSPMAPVSGKDDEYVGNWPNPFKLRHRHGAKKGNFSNGHILAHNNGGIDEGINIFVQDRLENQKASKPYQQAEAAAKAYNTKSFNIELLYEGSHLLTDIPSKIIYTIHKKDAADPIVYEIDNPPNELPSMLVKSYQDYLENKLKRNFIGK